LYLNYNKLFSTGISVSLFHLTVPHLVFSYFLKTHFSFPLFVKSVILLNNFAP
jgi:hypothetical protein